MRQKLSISIIGLIIFSTVLSFSHAPIAHANRTIVVATDVLNVRETPDAHSTIVSKVQRGESYPVVDSRGEWLKIQVTSSKAGWVASYLVTENSPSYPSQRTNGASNVQVLTDDLRVRSGPGTNFTVVAYIHTKDSVTYLEENENWVKIRTNGAEGWVSKEFVTILANAQTNPTPSQRPSDKHQLATITTDRLNVRSGPSTQSEVLDSLSEGKQVTVIGQKHEWLNISYGQTTGWIHQDYASIHNGSSSGEGGSPKKQETQATITVSGLNVRSEPSLSGKIVDQILQGTTVTIINERNNWYEIQYANGKTGWVAGWFIEKKPLTVQQPNMTGDSSVVVVDNGTNIRSAPSTNARVIHRANEGDIFPIVTIEDNWYKIKLSDGTEAFVAGWIVTTTGNTPNITRAGAEQYLNNKVIVIDPGHGGRDVGAIGTQGTFEKDLTLRTSRLLQDKLKAAGATVILTRQNDTFVSLHARPQVANYHRADAFLSVHYDSIDDSSVTGTTTYYYQSADRLLADSVHHSLIQFTNLRDRQVRQENYLVLRESRSPSLLLELGYISNRGEELTVISGDFQERASTAIYQGLAQYFRDN